MKYASLLGLIWLLLYSEAAADIVLTAVVDGPSTVETGTMLGFNLFIRSTISGGQSIEGLDVNVNAATSPGGIGTGTAGKFVSPSQVFLLAPSNFDVISSGDGQAFSSNFAIPGSLIPDTDTLYGRVTLDTTGVAAGNYFIHLDQLAVFDTATPNINVVGVGVAYNIVSTAVPEPGSLALLSFAGCVCAIWRRYL